VSRQARPQRHPARTAIRSARVLPTPVCAGRDRPASTVASDHGAAPGCKPERSRRSRSACQFATLARHRGHSGSPCPYPRARNPPAHARVDAHVYTGIRRTERRQSRHQPLGRQGRRGAHHQDAAAPRPQQLNGRCAQVREGGTDVGQIGLAHRSESQWLPGEQCNAQLLFQPADLSCAARPPPGQSWHAAPQPRMRADRSAMARTSA
jgi:hypothetical protein